MKNSYISLILLASLLTSCNPQTSNSILENDSSSISNNLSQSESSSSEEIQAEKNFTYLTELDPIQKQIGYCQPTYNKCCLGSDKFLLNGFLIKQGISVHPGENEDTSLTYDISTFNYDTFVTTIGKNDQEANCKVEFKIYVDGNIKYQSGKVANNYMEMVEVDIKNASTLKLVVTNGGDSHSFDSSTFAYPTLINKQDLKYESLKAETLPYVVEANKDINNYKTTAILKYNVGVFKKINQDLIYINDFDKTKLGKQFVNVTYDNFSTTHEVYCCNPNEYYSLTSIKDKWIDVKTNHDAPSFGMDIKDRTAFAIAGYNYADGIGLYPISESEPAYITIDVSSFNYDRFHAVVGKTRTALRNEIMVYVYADLDNLIYSSSFLTPGKEEVIDVSIAGVNTLKIVFDCGDDLLDYDTAGIANAFIYKK